MMEQNPLPEERKKREEHERLRDERLRMSLLQATEVAFLLVRFTDASDIEKLNSVLNSQIFCSQSLKCLRCLLKCF